MSDIYPDGGTRMHLRYNTHYPVVAAETVLRTLVISATSLVPGNSPVTGPGHRVRSSPGSGASDQPGVSPVTLFPVTPCS